MEKSEEKKFYEEKITEMVKKIESLSTLKFILSVIESYLKSRGI